MEIACARRARREAYYLPCAPIPVRIPVEMRSVRG